MMEFDITWEGIVFTIVGQYEEGEPATYDYPGSSEVFDIYSIHIGDACVDFMLNQKTIDTLVNEIIETYYR
jgi:hypothetical protein